MMPTLDQLIIQAETYEQVIYEINLEGESYEGELEHFEELLSDINQKICIEQNNGWMPF